MSIYEKLIELENKVNGISFRDDVAVDSIKSQLQMIIHRVFGKESHYLQQLASIRYHPNFSPASMEYKQERWQNGIGQLQNLLSTMKEDMLMFEQNREPELQKVEDSRSIITILFLSADPSNEARLRLDEEIREIKNNLQMSQLRDNFALKTATSVRSNDLSQAMLDNHPQIVHFSGHGTKHGALCIEDKQGNSQLIDPSALKALFEQFSDYVDCVLLNACYSEKQAKAIAQHIPFVVGMNDLIGDRAAIAFAVGFYQAIGAGTSIEKAFHMGKVQIMLSGISEERTPILLAHE